MNIRNTIKILLIVTALLIASAAGVWVIFRGYPPSIVRSADDRMSIEKSIGCLLSDKRIYQYHLGWTDTTSYYRLTTTEGEYFAILNSGNWEEDMRDGTAGFGERPLWWRPPLEDRRWKYYRHKSPYGTGGFEVLIRNPDTRLTYFMTFTE